MLFSKYDFLGFTSISRRRTIFIWIFWCPSTTHFVRHSSISLFLAICLWRIHTIKNEIFHEYSFKLALWYSCTIFYFPLFHLLCLYASIFCSGAGTTRVVHFCLLSIFCTFYSFYSISIALFYSILVVNQNEWLLVGQKLDYRYFDISDLTLYVRYVLFIRNSL